MVLSIISAAVFVPSMVAVDSIYLNYAEMYGRVEGHHGIYFNQDESEIREIRVGLGYCYSCLGDD